MPEIELVTLGLVRELVSGDVTVTLAAEPSLASFGDEEDALLEARMFLSEHLAKAEPEVVARFALPEAARLHTTHVTISRDDLPRRWNIETPITVTSLVIPTVPNTRGLRDSWVMVLPLMHTFFHPTPKEHADDDFNATKNFDDAIESEVKRICSARELTPLEYLDLLPARYEHVEKLDVTFHRGGGVEVKKGADLRKRVAEHEARKHSIDVLESVAEARHAGLLNVNPRPFPLRDKELALLRSTLATTTRASTLIVGKERVGKTGLFRAWLEGEYEVNRPRFVFATSGARLIAGMSGFGQWQERIRRVMEAAERLDAILYFDDLGDLFTDRPGGHVDLPSAMRPFLEDGRVRVVGEIREDVLERVEAHNGGFFACFGRVRLEPFDAKQSLHVLNVLNESQKKKHPDRLRLSDEANATLVELADRYLPYESFPGKAVRLALELRAAKEIELGSGAEGTVLKPEAVHEAFSVRTGVPMFLLRDDKSLRVDDVFAQLKQRLVGQDEAVKRVAELVCVVKAGLQPSGKPLATLLFVGPTGVGKTELARALAELLFSGSERLVRFDMSEYSSAYATERLFRGTDGGEGLLTRKVREQPFCVVLLDEIEKAHPAAFDLLLQVCGEGRLTDGRGKTAYFHNAIIILTSNLGAAHRRGQAGFAGQGSNASQASRESSDTAHYNKVVRETFRPEFVNRIDRVVAFRTLAIEDIREVARIATTRASRRRGIIERGVDLKVSDHVINHLAEGGMSEAYGARALRRHVERELVTPLGRLISGWGGIDGERIAVASMQEPKESGEEPGEEHAGMRFGVVRVPARRSNNAAHALGAITSARRRMHRQLMLDRIVQMKDHIDFLVAQLGYGDGRKRKRQRPEDVRDGQELAHMTGEHARLAALTEGLDTAFADICAVEELALVGFMQGDPVDALRGESIEIERRFRGVLVHALVAQEPRRNKATLMIKELDGSRAFDHWLVPFLREIESESREWRVDVHIDSDKEPSSTGVPWPAARRWGPSRTPAFALEKLTARDRTFRNVMLRVEGDHAAIWLALEAGLHRFTGFNAATAGSPPAHLHISLILQRSNVTDSEWTPPGLDPPNAQIAENLTHETVNRAHFYRSERIEIVGAQKVVELPFEEYWPRFEEVALEHLLLFERSDLGLDRDNQLRPLLDETFAEVRELARYNKIEAIKKYRELTGAGLRESKEAVEAMTGG